MSMMALAQQLQTQGRGGDTILAHITPEEAQLLESRGGAGTLNPNTGLPEYGWLDDLWKGVKKVWNNTVVPIVKKLAPVIIPAVSIFFPAAIPAIGAWFGATGATAAVVGTAALSAGVTLASGGTLEQAIKGAALGAAASYVTPILGAKANQLLGGTLSPTVQSYLGSALVQGGITAARGGSVRDVFTAAATGAATAYLGTLAKNYYQSINDKMATGKLNITQKTADGSLITAADAETYKKAGLSETQIANALKAQGVSDAHANLAAKSIVANNSAEQTATILAEYAGKTGNAVMNATTGKDAIANSITLGNNSDILLRAEDANLMARDAVLLKNQGVPEGAIQEHLQASGASTGYARTAAQMAYAGNDAATIANKIQTTAQYNVNNASSDYSKGQVYNSTDYVVPREVGQVMNEQQQALADSIPYKEMVTSGQITVDQASTYADAGYKPADVTKLISVGYTPADLQDLAAVGVNGRDLVTLSNTKFAEGQINDLMAGGATVTDIATTSRVIDSGKIDVATASQLLTRDVSGSAITQLANKGQAQAAVNSNLSGVAIDKLANGGFDINKAVALQKSGVDVNQMINDNEWSAYQKLLATPTATATAGPAAPVDPTAALVNSGTITAQEVSDLTANGYSKADISSLISKGYTAPDLMDLSAAGVPVSTLTSLAQTQFPETQINDLMSAGASANDIATASNIVNAGKISLDNASKLLSKDYTGFQINGLAYSTPKNIEALANSNITGDTYSKLANGGWDISKAAQLSTSGTDVNALISAGKWDDYRMISQAPAGTIPVKDASGKVSYFEASTGNTLDASGKVITYAKAPEVGGGTQTAGAGPLDVEVAGRPGKVGQESAVRGPLTPGNVLASDADIDAGRATFNDASNAWETPVRTPESEYTYTTPAGEVVGPPAPPSEYTYTTPPGEVVGPPAPVAPPANEYTYTTPPGEVVGPPQPPTTAPVAPPTQVTPTPLPPAAPAPSTIPPWMPDGSAVYGEQNGRPIFVTPDGALYTGTGDLLGNVTPPGQTMGPPAPPVVAPPTAPGPEYTYTTPPGEVVGPPAPPVVAPPTAPVVAPPTAPGPEYTYTTPPGEVVGPPAPTPVEPPSVTVPGQTDDGTIEVRAPREPEPPLSPLVPGDSTPRPPVVNVDLTQPPPLSPLTPGDSTPRPPVTEVDITQPPAPAPVEVITPATPYVPVPTPPVGEDPKKWKGWGPIDPLKFGDVGKIYNPGLNPGWVQPSPFYQTYSPIQSQYYWGQHPYQPGPRFDQTLYNTVPEAPQTPFGLQQMYTPTDLNQYLSQFTAGPVAPR
jgi:hypothetical protein